MTRRRRRRQTEEKQMGIPNHAAAASLADVVDTLVPVFSRYPAFYG